MGVQRRQRIDCRLVEGFFGNLSGNAREQIVAEIFQQGVTRLRVGRVNFRCGKARITQGARQGDEGVHVRTRKPRHGVITERAARGIIRLTRASWRLSARRRDHQHGRRSVAH